VPVSRLIPNESSVDNLLLLAATETTTEHGMAPLIAGLKEVL
jgi:glycine dehydrogenase subunit 1